MTLTNPAHAQARLIRLSRAMVWLTTIGIVLIAVLVAVGFAIPDWLQNMVLAKLGQAGLSLTITPLGRVLAALVLAIPVGVMLYGLLAVRRMFVAFTRGDIFNEYTARQLQVFAATVLLQGPLGPLTSTALSAALSVGNPPGNRAIMVAFSTNDYFALIVGGVLLAAATIMREAAQLSEENKSFI
jgi:hypothetical protein